MTRETASSLRSRLLAWYSRARRDLPWRRTRDPYAVWVSETMLQQTRVETVIPYYERFLRALPTVAALAEAPESQVLALWSGLGYYRRARMLHAAARGVLAVHGGELPSEVDALRTLEGVGAYTAGAIASIAFGRRAALVDGNVARVLARLGAIEDDVKASRGLTRVWRLAEELSATGDGDPGDWNQALMELGATVCTPRTPVCDLCPVRDLCLAHERGLTARLPRVGPKKKPVTVSRAAIVLASSARVLLARRRPGALFGGLWEPPSTSGSIRPLASRLGIKIRNLADLGHLVHTLSHRRLEIRVLRGALGARRRFVVPGTEYDAIEAVPIDRLPETPLASLTARILRVANVGPASLR